MLINYKYSKRIAATALFIVILAAFFMVAKVPALAQTEANNLLWGGTEGNVQNEIGLGNEDPRIVIAKIIRILLGFLGIIAVLIIMYAGWLWMSSQGDEKKIEQAKKILKNGIIGLIIILMAFAIASFVLYWLARIGSGEDPGGRPIPPGGGIGALGLCTVESVYPEPGQKEVPRNTSIIVTFREEINLSTICESTVEVDGEQKCCAEWDGDNDICGTPSNIIPENVRIYKETDGDSCDEDGDKCEEKNVTDVSVITSDNRTFVFIPKNYLGDGLHYFNYVVYLSNDIEKTDGTGVFDTCRTDYFDWMFEVSDKVDLTPPQVKEAGVFPRQDSERDSYSTSTAVQATSTITIAANPQPQVLATFGAPVATGISPALRIVPNSQNQRFEQPGTITISINPGAVTATIGIGSVGLGSANIEGNRINFSNIFSVELVNSSDSYENGNSWTVAATAYIPADTITVGEITYLFVLGTPVGNQIQIGGTPGPLVNTARNIASKLENDNEVVSAYSGRNPRTENRNIVFISARIAGTAGNSIAISTSNADKMPWRAMQGGAKGGENVTVNGREDEPRNAVIKINFNEAMMPVRLSGDAESLQNYIKVICLSGDSCVSTYYDNAEEWGKYFFECGEDGPDEGEEGDDVCLKGTFEISNQYRTVEFLSNNQCGVNACGEPIFCLPENSNLRVDIVAAHLESCADAVCTARTPYRNCSNPDDPSNGVCQDGSTPPLNFPLSDVATLDGAMDVALNSLDGNRSGNAQGPASFYNENLTKEANGGNGDNFLWSFWISDKIELDPPHITFTSPTGGVDSANLIEPVNVKFNKIMMSSSLKSGSVVIDNGQTRVEHKRMNLWNFANLPLGYWIASEDIEDSSPPDASPDYTEGQIRHTPFVENISLRAQVGSGVKDIYQNCMKPSRGPACGIGEDETYNSCCSGTESTEASCD